MASPPCWAVVRSTLTSRSWVRAPLVGPAAAPDLAVDDSRSDALLCPVVGGIHPLVAQEGEQGGCLVAQVLEQAAVLLGGPGGRPTTAPGPAGRPSLPPAPPGG